MRIRRHATHSRTSSSGPSHGGDRWIRPIRALLLCLLALAGTFGYPQQTTSLSHLAFGTSPGSTILRHVTSSGRFALIQSQNLEFDLVLGQSGYPTVILDTVTNEVRQLPLAIDPDALAFPLRVSGDSTRVLYALRSDSGTRRVIYNLLSYDIEQTLPDEASGGVVSASDDLRLIGFTESGYSIGPFENIVWWNTAYVVDAMTGQFLPIKQGLNYRPEDWSYFGGLEYHDPETVQISGDGLYVVFGTRAFREGEDNRDGYKPIYDFYRRDLTTGELVLVSTGPDGELADGDCLDAEGQPDVCVSFDGSKVFFVENANSLYDWLFYDGNLWFRDLAAGKSQAVGRGKSVACSSSGDRVAFVRPDGLRQDIAVYAVQNRPSDDLWLDGPPFQLVNRNSAGALAEFPVALGQDGQFHVNASSDGLYLSDDPTCVLFSTNAVNLGPEHPMGQSESYISRSSIPRRHRQISCTASRVGRTVTLTLDSGRVSRYAQRFHVQSSRVDPLPGHPELASQPFLPWMYTTAFLRPGQSQVKIPIKLSSLPPAGTKIWFTVVDGADSATTFLRM